MSIEQHEMMHLKSTINRTPTSTELHIIAAQWSEHCSYKSSKKHLKMLPMSGPLVIKEKGYDSGVLDVGNGYVVTVHIESHNHPSAVEPYGGAATGVGGIIRDILSSGTRPIAIFDSLRFGDISKDKHARWLFKNAVSGIADYGNCLGIPTIGGEVEFDDCYTSYALVDVAAVGFGKKQNLVKNHADIGDVVVLIGGATGRDGVGGSQFASDNLQSQDRSAIQIPDPFIEKLIIEVILAARDQNLIHAMKDLGGGGLSCAVSETADALSVGIEFDIDSVHTRESNMHPDEIMISESQERMLLVTSREKLIKLQEICQKFRVACSAVGIITSGNMMHVKKGSQTLANLPTSLVANAPLLDLPSIYPKYLNDIPSDDSILPPTDLCTVLMNLLCSPNIASKIWVYSQYDHEVGIRTVIKPGCDASVLRLDNGKSLSVKIDANPKHCYLDPRNGAIGCFEEACRNVVCTGARPIGMIDHLQFGNPNDPEIFWTFLESLNGLSDFAKYLKIPCVGGKVSLYNETQNGPIKPTPLIGVLGLIDGKPLHSKIQNNDTLLIIGDTKDELGGSEYYEYIHNFIGGKCPTVDFESSKKNMNCILDVIQKNLVNAVHDCSKGGLAVAISEMCMIHDIGCVISLDGISSEVTSLDKILFSESHCRYMIVSSKDNLQSLLSALEDCDVFHRVVGKFTGNEIVFENTIKLDVNKAQKGWRNSLEELILHG